MLIRVKVQTGARSEIFRQQSEDHFFIAVRERAERNEANCRVLELLTRHFNVPSGAIRMIKGHHAPTKLMSVEWPP